MIDCLELFADIVEIYPIPEGKISFSKPFNVPAYSISASEISIVGATEGTTLLGWLRTQQGMIKEGLSVASHVRTFLIDGKSTAKATTKTGVAGKYYHVSISAKSYADINDIMSLVEYVNACESFNAFVVDSEENIYVVRSIYPATSMSVTQQLPKDNQSEITLSLESPSGILRVRS